MQSAIRQTSRLHRWALLIVCLAAFFLRFQGINWPAFHPDETPIGSWVDQAARGAPMKDKLYAHGFFQMIKPTIWVSQAMDYAANAMAYQRGLKNRVHRTGDNAILVARWFNVWASMLVCLTGYLLVRRITRSPWAGVFGAALLGLAQYPVEHSHYAETDIAMLLTLTTTLWLMAVAADTRSKRSLVLAALVGGFAAGTKFQLVLLLPAILILAVTDAAGPSFLKKGLRAFGLLTLALGCCVLGFLVAMPEAMDWSWFLSGLAWEKTRLYRETALNLGPLQDDVWVRYTLHFRDFLSGLQTMGWGWLALAAAGLPCLALRDYRRYWTVTLLFPVLYLIYWIFQAPWVRSQEFMAFLPGFAVLAALPLMVLWRSGRFVPRLAALILVAGTLAANGINGCRVASLFGWTDTRLLAKQWLQAQIPAQSKIVVERYAEPAWADTGNPPAVKISKIEKDGLACLTRQGADYLLRAANISGRGLRNPLTSRLYPHNQILFDEFLRHSERLRAWAPLPPQGMATFVSPAIELYGLRHPAPNRIIDLALPQPLSVINFYDDERGRLTFFPIGHKLGAATELLIDCQPRTIAIGGPEAPQGPVYLIFNTAERSATVIIRGFGQTRHAALGPYDAVIVPLERSPWRPRLSQFEEITLCTEHVKNILYIPCFARVAFSPSEAIRHCLDLGAEEAVWKTFSEQDLARVCDPATAYLLAVCSARWAWAEQLEAAAERVEAALATLARADPATVRINGNSGYYYNEFARTRIHATQRDIINLCEGHDAQLIVKEVTTIDCLNLAEPTQSASGLPPRYEAVLQLPVSLARGRYTFCGEVMKTFDGPTNGTSDAAFEFHFGQPEQRIARQVPGHPDTWAPLTFEFQVAREIQPRFIVRTRTPMRLDFRNTEIRWSLSSALASVREDLAMARAAQAVAGGKFANAQQCLAGLEPETSRWNELEIRQLNLAAARGIGNREASLQAARCLLELAPGDYASLQVLGETNRIFQAVAAELDANLKTPVEFGAHMNLVGFILNPNGIKVRCIWEAKKNETPPMAVSFWIRRHGEWRKKQVRILSDDRQWLAKGERVAVEVKLNNAFAGYNPETIALGLETAVRWHPGALPVVGNREPVVPLSELLRRQAPGSL